jgi:hypothetical protein
VAFSASRRPLQRAWDLTLAPQPNDLALAQFSFRSNSRAQRISPASLRLAARGPFGDDYIAAATPILRTPGQLQILVVLVNRPSPLLDPAQVHLRLSARRALGTPVLWTLSDPFSHSSSGLTPALCDLPLRGPALAGPQLRPLRSEGGALAGFDAASAVAQAYDVVCGLPFEHSFEADITGSPVPKPPLCTPCDPAPGYACPLAQPNICAVPVAGAARRASPVAH